MCTIKCRASKTAFIMAVMSTLKTANVRFKDEVFEQEFVSLAKSYHLLSVCASLFLEWHLRRLAAAYLPPANRSAMPPFACDSAFFHGILNVFLRPSSGRRARSSAMQESFDEWTNAMQCSPRTLDFSHAADFLVTRANQLRVNFTEAIRRNLVPRFRLFARHFLHALFKFTDPAGNVVDYVKRKDWPAAQRAARTELEDLISWFVRVTLHTFVEHEMPACSVLQV